MASTLRQCIQDFDWCGVYDISPHENFTVTVTVVLFQPMATFIESDRLQGCLHLWEKSPFSGELESCGKAIAEDPTLEVNAEPMADDSETIVFHFVGLKFELDGTFKWKFELFLDGEAVDSQDSVEFTCESSYGF